MNDLFDQGATLAPDIRPTDDGTRDARGRFGPGNPGGPGRARGSRAKALMDMDALGSEKVNEIIRGLADRALSGDNAAAEILLRRVWTPSKARAIQVDLPKIETTEDALVALGRIVEAAAAGEIDLDSAKTMSEIIEKRAGSLELQAAQERMEALAAEVMQMRQKLGIA